MSVYCEINLLKPKAGFYTPGSTVSGKIKYSLDKETVFSKILVSLKGHGSLTLNDESVASRPLPGPYRNSEDYVDVENIIYENEKRDPLPAGSYEVDFNYQLPENIPDSLRYIKRIPTPRYTVWCKIEYYVCIKFEKPELLSFNKAYKKKIKVVSGSTPRLPTEPTIYEEQTSLFQLRNLFSSRKSIVHIKATMNNSVVQPGDSVKVDLEVENRTNLILKAVEIKLVQVNTFSVKGLKEPKIIEPVKDTLLNYGAVQSGETKSLSVEITIPEGLKSIHHSNIISRDYAVAIKAVIPTPHWNLGLQSPVQMIDRVDGYSEASGSATTSYWQVMREKKTDYMLSMKDSSDEEMEKKRS